jgi:hypothetical protein
MSNSNTNYIKSFLGIISSHYTVIKRAKREAVKLSFMEVLPVIKNAAYNLRYRFAGMQSKNAESCVSDDDYCDEQCVPLHTTFQHARFFDNMEFYLCGFLKLQFTY